MHKEIFVNQQGSIECQCGTDIVVEMNARALHVKCEGCEQPYFPRFKNPTWQQLLEILGVSLHLDYDGQLIARFENWVPEGVENWLFQCQADIREELEHTARKERAIYIGGTMANQRHHYCRGWRNGAKIYQHIGRAHWEVYEFRGRNDPRLYFVAKTTSKKKAKAI